MASINLRYLTQFIIKGWILRPHPVMYIICFVFSQLNLIFCGAVSKYHMKSHLYTTANHYVAFLSGLYSFAPRCSKDDPQCGAAITVFVSRVRLINRIPHTHARTSLPVSFSAWLTSCCNTQISTAAESTWLVTNRNTAS